MNVSEVMSNGNVRIVVPVSFRYVKQQKVIVIPENEGTIQQKTPLLIAIANGFLWQRMLDERRAANINELARMVGQDRALVSHTLQLALLSPEIVHMALSGTLPQSVTLKSFRAGLPADWSAQKAFLGIG